MICHLPLLSGLRTPDDIAKQISEDAGTPMTGRTVWDRAKRLGLGKKMGRTPMIHVDDIPELLVVEMPKPSRVRNGQDALRTLHQARRKRAGK